MHLEKSRQRVTATVPRLSVLAGQSYIVIICLKLQCDLQNSWVRVFTSLHIKQWFVSLVEEHDQQPIKHQQPKGSQGDLVLSENGQ